MISLIVPVFNGHQLATRAIDSFIESSSEPLEVIVIDNGSDDRFIYTIPESQYNHLYRFIHNKENIGCFPAIKQGIEVAKGEYVAAIHSDVIVHEFGWNDRVASLFEDENVGMIGFWGAKATDIAGASIDTIGNLAGIEVGFSWEAHGKLFTGDTEVVIVDSLVMIFRKNAMNDIYLEDLPPHHWFDRLISIRLRRAGYKIMMAGVMFDHEGGNTYRIESEKFREFAKRWCEDRDIKTVGGSYDIAIAEYGQVLWVDMWKSFLMEKIQENDTYNLADFGNIILDCTDDYSNDKEMVISYNLSRYL